MIKDTSKKLSEVKVDNIFKPTENEQKTLQTRIPYTEENLKDRNFLLGEVVQKTAEKLIKIKLADGAVAPILGTTGSAGYDLSVYEVEWISPTQVKYNTGVAMAIPEGYVGLVFPRSSVVKTDLRLANCVGVVDSDYRGFISAVFDYKEAFDGNPFREIYSVGERCCQIVLVPYLKAGFEIVDSLDETERGTNGYGHTGK